MRRGSLALLAGALLLAGCESKAPSISADYAPVRLTESVYVIHGPNELPNKTNQGFMNNPGFVLTKKGVVVIDPGSSVRIGEMVLAKIATVTKDPVIAVFNTHIHGDHWLGNQAIKAAYPKAVIYAHANMKAKAPGIGEQWVTMLNQMTDGALKGTQIVPPDVHVDNDEVLKLGDKQFRLYHTGKAHTDGDLMIEVVEDKVLFLGDNVLVGRLGRMDDGHFAGNVAAIDVALKTGAVHFVPGHGPSNGREPLKAYQSYLRTLHATVKKLYAEGLTDFEMKPKVAQALAPYQKWGLFDVELGRHISLALQQVMDESF
jgi:glyoxylase-like metal-dependent hydrolase (beta-lactamase superfamily II)